MLSSSKMPVDVCKALHCRTGAHVLVDCYTVTEKILYAWHDQHQFVAKYTSSYMLR